MVEYFDEATSPISWRNKLRPKFEQLSKKRRREVPLTVHTPWFWKPVQHNDCGARVLESEESDSDEKLVAVGLALEIRRSLVSGQG